MQKVSKQSLAMIALSILLAISIALTFTFAALSDKKTATGTITFSGNVALEFTGDSIDTSGTITIEAVTTDATAINTALSNAKFQLAAASQAAYIKVTASVELNGSKEGAVALTSKTADGYTAAGLVQTSSAVINAATPTALGDLFTATFDSSKLVADSNGSINNITIKFVIDANTNSAFGA